jgi:hypothetical protein
MHVQGISLSKTYITKLPLLAVPILSCSLINNKADGTVHFVICSTRITFGTPHVNRSREQGDFGRVWVAATTRHAKLWRPQVVAADLLATPRHSHTAVEGTSDKAEGTNDKHGRPSKRTPSYQWRSRVWRGE